MIRAVRQALNNLEIEAIQRSRSIKCVRRSRRAFISRAARKPNDHHNSRSSGRRDAAAWVGGNWNKASRSARQASNGSGVYHDECGNVDVWDLARLYLFLFLVSTALRVCSDYHKTDAG